MSARELCVACRGAMREGPSLVGRDRMYGVPGEYEVVVCSRCGSGATLPIVPEAAFVDFYPTSYAPHVSVEESSGLIGLARRSVEAVLRLIHLHQLPLSKLPARPGRILDIGCGRGDRGELLIKEGWSVVGVEPSPEACAVATSRGLEMFNGTLSTVDLEGREFDAISFEHSLEHVYDPNDDLELVLKRLAPGGLLLVTVPNFGSWQRKLFGADWFHLDLPRHRFHYTAAGLEDLFERHGLRIKDVGTTNSPFGLTGSATNRIAGRWIYDTPGKTRAISYLSVALHPLNWAIGLFGGGDYLHVIAEKPN